MKRVKFGGFIVKQGQYQIDPELTEDLRQFPVPENRTDLRSFMGLAQQLGGFSTDLTTILEPLRSLLSYKADWAWQPYHQQAFEEARIVLSNPPHLTYFDPRRQTQLLTDASRLHGLGFLLRQKCDEGTWRTVQCGSRTLAKHESNWSGMAELEALAVAWAAKKCAFFLDGLDHFEIITDSNPLVSILNNRRLDQIQNDRLLKLKTTLLRYNFTARWQAGKRHKIADALSRKPRNEPRTADQVLTQEEDADREFIIATAISQLDSAIPNPSLDAQQEHIQTIRRVGQQDPTYKALLRRIHHGWPDSKQQLLCEDELLAPYYKERESLYAQDDIILHGPRLLVPGPMRRQILHHLHAAHQGISKTLERARMTVWWPTIATDVTDESKPAQSDKNKTPEQLNNEVVAQGDIVRNLKTQKAAKSEVDAAVKLLLQLKGDYKSVTGTEWKPGTAPSGPQKTINVNELSLQISAQGDKVRKLKSEKATKDIVDPEVKLLLTLKDTYKKATGSDWKPEAVVPAHTDAPPSPEIVHNSTDQNTLLEKISAQGDKVRDLKSKKVEKSVVEAEVKVLLALKADYKSLTGSDWKPGAVAQTKAPVPKCDKAHETELLNQITEQGNKVRQLKSEKADKTVVDTAVKSLLSLKEQFKTLTGNVWKPEMATPIVVSPSVNGNESDLTSKINQQGEVVRKAKSGGAAKAEIDTEVKKLLDLKAEYKALTGTDFPTGGRTQKTTKPKEEKVTKAKSEKKEKEKKPTDVEDGAGTKKQTRLGLEAKKEENLSDWYSQVITKGELIEYYDVSGCYILRPWSYSIWEAIKDWFDAEIKKLGVQNCYFPIFVSRAALEKEKTHIADFSPEVAWVTKSGDSELAEPVAVRPTSETVMYPAYAKWVQSYRDLPIKLNQWNNVVRWEFKHPQPFLRTREFLWQEGHNAYANKEDCQADVKTIVDLYAKIYTDLLAIPVIKGRKTEKEKFAGGDYTLTIEGYVAASGRGVQAATSHYLGQNFSKMFEIVFDHPETQEKTFAYQNSWGVSTRSLGVMVMVHGDNQGLVIPPRVALVQVVIVPCGLSDVDRQLLQDSCDELEKELLGAGLRVKGDYRDNYSPGWKFNHWELKGVPIRVELGPKDIKNKQIVAVRRDNGQKVTMKRESAAKDLATLLENIQQNLFNKASEEFTSHTIQVTEWSQFTPNLDKKNVILSPFCGEMECEDAIKTDSTRDASEVAEVGAPSMGAKSLCIPLEQLPMKPNARCIHPKCTRKPKFYTLFGRSY
ncbi:hypothetical protein PPYR_11744 [Photinus pyralis]|uniref:Bifunctional glutamate/proline--tRNA ligase n=1 Tax=Photinus pyralis TaxID=7054 RepID=A0A5N4AC55_PHOPY|nr:hypothetical protein PPYR_11744 [Photinus pyralis]